MNNQFEKLQIQSAKLSNEDINYYISLIILICTVTFYGMKIQRYLYPPTQKQTPVEESPRNEPDKQLLQISNLIHEKLSNKKQYKIEISEIDELHLKLKRLKFIPNIQNTILFQSSKQQISELRNQLKDSASTTLKFSKNGEHIFHYRNLIKNHLFKEVITGYIENQTKGRIQILMDDHFFTVQQWSQFIEQIHQIVGTFSRQMNKVFTYDLHQNITKVIQGKQSIQLNNYIKLSVQIKNDFHAKNKIMLEISDQKKSIFAA